MGRIVDTFETTRIHAPVRLPDADEQTSRHAYRLLMTTCKAVVVGRFKKPSKPVSSGWPEHKVSSQLSGYGVRSSSILFQVSPLRPHAEHELGLAGDGPWLLEEKVGVPFR